MTHARTTSRPPARLPRGRVFLLALVLLLAFGGLASVQQTKTLYWQRYDPDITILKNGDFRVEETQELVFTNGTFRFGQREIPINRFSDLTDITVRELNGPEYKYSENDEPNTYRYYQDNGNLYIRYNFPASTDTRRTIVLGYTVVNGLRYYPDKGVDQLDWKAIPGGNPFPTQSSTITLHLPEGATFTNYGLYGKEGDAKFQPGSAMRRSRSTALSSPARK